MITPLSWYPVTKTDPRAVDLYSRHYSATKNNKTRTDWLQHGIVAPGQCIVLLTPDARALFVWLKQRFRRSLQTGINCAVFRNEGPHSSSNLILQAEHIAWNRWPGERLYTYVDPHQVNSPNPGYCFKVAGWHLVRHSNRQPVRTSKGLLILEKFPERSQ